MKKCPSCGFSNQDYSKFCISCGAMLPVQANDVHPSPSSYYAPPPPTPQASPYAAMPHIPESAKRKDPSRKNSALGGFALIAGIIGVVVLMFILGGQNPYERPHPPASSLIPPGEYSMPPSPSVERDAPYTYRLDDVTISDGPDTERYIISGTITVTSTQQFNSAYLNVKVYNGNTYLTEGAKFVTIKNNKISFSVDVHMGSLEASRADYARVSLTGLQ